MCEVFEMEKEKLLRTFPAEIWQLIFERTQDPNDLCNSIEASTAFGQLMSSQRTFYLLPSVLRILDDQNYLNANDAKAIRNCRAVSYRWGRAVQTFLDGQPLRFMPKGFMSFGTRHGNYYRDDSIVSGMQFCPHDFTLEELQDEILPCLSKAYYQEHNPFPGRWLCFVEGTAAANATRHGGDKWIYREHTQELLQKLGHHFWHADMYIWDDEHKMYQLLRKYVGLMKNLRSLYITSPEFSGRGYLVLSKYLSPSELEFPKLEYLEFLSTKRLPGADLNEILAANRNLKGLEIFRKYQDGLDVTLIGSPQILSITCVTADAFLSLPKNEYLQSAHFNLLHIVSESFNLSQVFGKLEEYGATLEKLCLEPPKELMLSERFQEQLNRSLRPLNLRKLKKLDIKLSCNWSLDFLVGLKSLQLLILRLDDTNRALVDHECFQFGKEIFNFYHGFSDRVLECNMWELIPDLKEIRLIVWNREIEIYKRR